MTDTSFSRLTSSPHQLNDYSPLILWVDDDETSLDFGMHFIQRLHYRVQGATDGEQAIQMVEKEKPDLILLDIQMPKMNGYDVCRILKSNPETNMIPILMITGLADKKANIRGIQAGADDYITKPYDIVLLESRINNSLKRKIYYDQILYYQQKLEHYNKDLEEEICHRIREIIDTQEVTIFALAKLAESRNRETGAHLERIRSSCRELAILLKKNNPKYRTIIDDAFINHIFLSSPLHDIGKVGVSDSVLLKPAPLTKEEFEEAKQHTIIGGQTLESAENKLQTHNNFLKMGREIAYYHHEKWDGTGYPYGLTSEEIPLAARILACSDVYDALTHKRVYKSAYTHEEACDIIHDSCGTHFDPDISFLFLENHRLFKEISSRTPDG